MEERRPFGSFYVYVHFGMGLLFLVLAGILIRQKRFGQFEFSDGTAYGIAALLVLYGLFRIWRGRVEWKNR